MFFSISLFLFGLWYHGKQLYQPNNILAGRKKINKLRHFSDIYSVYLFYLYQPVYTNLPHNY